MLITPVLRDRDGESLGATSQPTKPTWEVPAQRKVLFQNKRWGVSEKPHRRLSSGTACLKNVKWYFPTSIDRMRPKVHTEYMTVVQCLQSPRHQEALFRRCLSLPYHTSLITSLSQTARPDQGRARPPCVKYLPVLPLGTPQSQWKNPGQFPYL